jgi:glycosyltransferase involved in cell wall biosynthesis
MERPRVLILGKLPPPYIGPAVATRIILESSLNERYELHHFDTRINDDVADIGSLKLSKLVTIRTLYKAFRQKLEEVNPDIVLVPIGQTSAGFFKDMPLIRMADKAGAKVVVQLRGSEWRLWFDALDVVRKSWVRKSITRAQGAIVLGENLKSIFQGLVPDDRIFVVPNGGDYTFPERKNRELRVLYLANYLPGKGLLELLKALLILHSKEGIPEFQFVAHGSWNSDSYREACMAIASQLPNCIIGNSVSGAEKWQALADADIFVFAPKAPEGHPWSIVEALAAGLPVVSTDRGAIEQSVKDSVNGFLLPEPDPLNLAKALEQLLIDESLRRNMGAASRALYERDFTAAAMVKRLAVVFDEVLHL